MGRLKIAININTIHTYQHLLILPIYKDVDPTLPRATFPFANWLRAN